MVRLSRPEYGRHCHGELARQRDLRLPLRDLAPIAPDTHAELLEFRIHRVAAHDVVCGIYQQMPHELASFLGDLLRLVLVA